jgi:shikimate kinase
MKFLNGVFVFNDCCAHELKLSAKLILSSQPVNKVFLIGYMGVGKSTIGKRLARLLGLPFHDLDSLIEEKSGMDVSTIFSSKGEAFFRERERFILNDFCSRPEPFVMATGGGTPVDDRNLELMKSSGRVVWLEMPLKMIIDRLLQGTGRPLLADKSGEELMAFVEKHYAERLPRYEQAHFHFDASNPSASRIEALADSLHSK